MLKETKIIIIIIIIYIYNILLNKKTNVIYKAHIKNNDNYINNLKHYYYSSKKKHFLLSSSQYEIKLWNISSEIITNELKITAEKNLNYNKNNNNNYSNNNYEYNYFFNCSCLLFNEDNYIIFGGAYLNFYSNSKVETRYEIKIFNGNFQNNLGNNQIKGANYIEAAYIGDKSYILLEMVMHNHMIIIIMVN